MFKGHLCNCDQWTFCNNVGTNDSSSSNQRDKTVLNHRKLGQVDNQTVKKMPVLHIIYAEPIRTH